MEDFIGELISELLGFLINNNKIPKAVRYGLVIIIVGVVAVVGVSVGLSSEYLIGKVIAFLVTALMLAAGIFLVVKIHKS